MEQSNAIDEVKVSYSGLDRDEAHEIAYIIENLPIFEYGDIVKITVDLIDSKLMANGFVHSDVNFMFRSDIKKTKLGYEITTICEEVLTHKDVYSVDKIHYNKDNIKIVSKIENRKEIIKNINYPDNHRNFTK